MMKYLLSANCILVNGFNRDLICDTQHNLFYLIGKNISRHLNKGAFDSAAFLDSESKDLFHLLLENDVIFEIEENEISFFPPFDFYFELPCKIHNAIIDIGAGYNYNILNIFSQLEALQCRHVEIRFFKTFEPSVIECMLDEQIMKSSIETIDLYLPFSDFDKNKEALSELKLINLRVHWLYIYDTPLDFDTTSYTRDHLFLTESIANMSFCGSISPFYFMVNPYLLTESIHHNSCLNRKISIDVNGNIKNCPSMSQSFGNINDTTLQEALDHPEFRKHWNIIKDQITVCKDCEFRYICTDCRAYIENPNDIYSKPLKCGYNPYTCEWEEWSTNPLKQKAIDYYGMREVLPEFKMKPDYVPSKSSISAAD